MDYASGERRILVPTGAPRLRFLPACQPDRVNVHARLEILSFACVCSTIGLGEGLFDIQPFDPSGGV